MVNIVCTLQNFAYIWATLILEDTMLTVRNT